jgi:RNA polymerase sigma-70 factor, ECF subfamily
LADDRELGEQIRCGDARAFEAFYREQGPRLRAFLVGNPQAAEDVMQETFTQIWRRPNGFVPERGTLRAYLFGAGRNRAAEWWRKHGSGVSNENPPDQHAEYRAETTSLVADAFERLPKEQPTLLWWREVEGQSYVELAEILEIPLDTVRSRLFAAREELRRVWHAAPSAKKEGA